MNPVELFESMFIYGLVFLAVCVCFCLLRAILGPRFTDRLVAINIIGTKTIVLICILACVFESSGLFDIAIVYALISFLAIVVLSKMHVKKIEGESKEIVKSEDVRQ